MARSSAAMTLKGSKEARRKLGPLISARVQRDVMIRLFDDARKEMQDYPPERTGQKSRRTYKLRDNWNRRPTFQATLRELVGVLTNRTPYGSYVQGKGTQAWMHKNRWQTNASVLKRLESRGERYMKRAIAKALR